MGKFKEQKYSVKNYMISAEGRKLPDELLFLCVFSRILSDYCLFLCVSVRKFS